MSSSSYNEPVSLIVISSVSIGIAAIAALWISLDILWRRGWRSMMTIMIPVYIINALYLWPITAWVYAKYGRPSKPAPNKPPHEQHHPPHAGTGGETERTHETAGGEGRGSGQSSTTVAFDERNRDEEKADVDDEEKGEGGDQGGDHACHSHGSSRPMFATVTVGVCHCGAGCVLGDVVGEWLVYGTHAGFGAHDSLLWAEYLVDFGFAFAFGIFFQYFSIAPMAGNYSLTVLWRALKADALSLLFFEIGLFGWMAIFQIGIFNWDLETNSVTYWWMMQIGMFLGHWTAVPINYWLIKKGIKAPCA